MKKLLICSIILLQILIFSACNTNTNDSTNLETNTTYSKEDCFLAFVDSKITMYIPNYYTQTSSQYIDKFYIRDNVATIMLTEDTNYSISNTDIDTYYNNAIQQYSNTFDEFNVISTQDVDYSFKGTGKIVEFSYTIYGKDEAKDMSCYAEYILLNNRTYIITCSTTSDTYQTYRDDFVYAVSTITIND